MKIAICEQVGENSPRRFHIWVGDDASFGYQLITKFGLMRVVGFEPGLDAGSVENENKEIIMSVVLLTSHELAQSVVTKLGSYQALVNAPSRVEVAPSVFIDKDSIMMALKTQLKAEYAKLGEQLKKL